MLLLARESRGYSQTEVAAKLRISQGKLSKAEKGEQSLSTTSIEQLAKITDYPLSFFYQLSPDAPVGHHYYRRKISIPKKIMVQMEAKVKIFRSNIDQLADSIELPEYNIPTIKTKNKTPEEISRIVRYELKIPKGPIENLVNILENNGVIIVKTDLFTNKIDGLSTVSEKGNRIIFLNMRMPNDRQRFSLAHELGHLIMHFDVPSFPEEVENEADRFASELLMPALEIRNALRFLNFSKLGDLKRYWKVSMRSLVQRAKALEIIDKNQYRNFQINFSKKGMTKNEPIPLPEEQAFIIEEVVRLHRKDLGYSLEELSRVVNLNQDEFRERFIKEKFTKLKIIRN